MTEPKPPKAKRGRVTLTTAQIEWLRNAALNKVHPREMAAHIGCCVDTVKRLLDRHDIIPAASPKHFTKRVNQYEQWDRPCMKCGSRRPRPKNQYVCDTCRSRASNEVDGVPDDYLMV